MVFILVVYFVNKYKDAEVRLEKERDNLRRSNLHLRKSYKTLRESYEAIKKSTPERLTGSKGTAQEMQLRELEDIIKAQKELMEKLNK